MKKERDFYHVSLKVFLKNQEGRVLALKADPKGSLAGFYDFPGGRIDTDEFGAPFEDMIARELQEEIGSVRYRLSLQPVACGRHRIPATMTKTGKDIHVLYVFFEAEYRGGDISISREHQGYDWLDFLSIEPEKYFRSGTLEGVRMYLQRHKTS